MRISATKLRILLVIGLVVPCAMLMMLMMALFFGYGVSDRELVVEPQPISPSMLPWSPDGSRIAFGYAGRIYLVESDGSRLQLIHSGDDEIYNSDDEIYHKGGEVYNFSSPNISPDGTRLAYAAREHSKWFPPWGKDYDWEIVTSDIDGAGQRRLTRSEGVDDSPVWSPSGSHIAFWSNGVLHTMLANGSNALALIPSDVVSSYSRPVWSPVWSPDGLSLAFTVLEEETKILYTVGADGSNLTKLGETTSPPAWSPDGQRIVFGAGQTRVGTDYLDNLDRLYTIDPDGSDLREIFSFPEESIGWAISVAWSPDGSEILFGNYVVGVDTLRLTELPTRAYGTFSLSPDGSRVAWLHNFIVPSLITGTEVIELLETMNLDGTDRRLLVKYNRGDFVAAHGRFSE